MFTNVINFFIMYLKRLKKTSQQAIILQIKPLFMTALQIP